MPEIKKQFTKGKMNKDVDERLVPNGEYRDAMNIQVATSEGSDVATAQNILGNKKIPVKTKFGDFDFDNDSVVVGALGAPPTINSQAEIANTGRYNNSDTGNTILRQTQLNTLLYTLPSIHYCYIIYF